MEKLIPKDSLFIAKGKTGLTSSYTAKFIAIFYFSNSTNSSIKPLSYKAGNMFSIFLCSIIQ